MASSLASSIDSQIALAKAYASDAINTAQYANDTVNELISNIDVNYRLGFAGVNQPTAPTLNDPEGPIKAANEMIERRKRMGMIPKPQVSTKEAEEQAAKNERARIQSVKAGAMHGSGKGAQSKVVTLDPRLESYAKKLGANIDTLKKIRGAK